MHIGITRGETDGFVHGLVLREGGVSAAAQEIVAHSPVERIGFRVAVERVMPVAAMQDVVAGAAFELVVAGSAVQ